MKVIVDFTQDWYLIEFEPFLGKKAKAYMTGVFEVKVNSITTAGEQSLFLDKADAELINGSKILIVDDEENIRKTAEKFDVSYIAREYMELFENL